MTHMTVATIPRPAAPQGRVARLRRTVAGPYWLVLTGGALIADELAGVASASRRMLSPGVRFAVHGPGRFASLPLALCGSTLLGFLAVQAAISPEGAIRGGLSLAAQAAPMSGNAAAARVREKMQAALPLDFASMAGLAAPALAVPAPRLDPAPRRHPAPRRAVALHESLRDPGRHPELVAAAGGARHAALPPLPPSKPATVARPVLAALTPAWPEAEKGMPAGARLIAPGNGAPIYEEVAPDAPARARRTAMIRPPVPSQSLPDGTRPAWLANAIDFPLDGADDRPMIALVIDDLGMDARNTRRTVAMDGPLTLSYLASAPNLRTQTDRARAAGHELLLHVPMEPTRKVDPGPGVLLTTHDGPEVTRRLREALGTFDGFIGINNHMGSRFTASADHMRVVMAELAPKGWLFLDSLTTPDSVAVPAARAAGVPVIERDVFLDDDHSPQAILRQLSIVERVARRHGSAVAIGHPLDVTLGLLVPWLRALPERGFRLVPLSALMKSRMLPSRVAAGDAA